MYIYIAIYIVTLKVKLLDQTNFPSLKQNANSGDKRGATPTDLVLHMD